MHFRLSLLAFSLVVAHAAVAAAPKKYTIQEIPAFCVSEDATKCGQFSYAYDINNQGVVVGYAQGPLVPDTEDVDNDDNVTEEIRAFVAHGYRWQGGDLVDLGDLGLNDSYAYAVNDDGVVVGRANKVVGVEDSTDTDIIQLRGFSAAPDEEMIDLGLPAELTSYVSAADIGADGVIVGIATSQVVENDTEYYARGFVRYPDSGSVVTIPALQPEAESALRAVSSARGEAVGFSYRDGIQRAIKISLVSPQTLIEIGDLGGTASVALGINDDGVIVGRALTENNQSSEGFIYDPLRTPVMRSIGLLNERTTYSSANAINSYGDVVGVAQATVSPRVYHAVFFDGATDELIDLNTRIDCAEDPDERWVLTEAVAINDQGQIVGYGSKGQKIRSFLLTPVEGDVAPSLCEPLEQEFENNSGGGASSWLLLPLMSLAGYFRKRKR